MRYNWRLDFGNLKKNCNNSIHKWVGKKNGRFLVYFNGVFLFIEQTLSSLLLVFVCENVSKSRLKNDE